MNRSNKILFSQVTRDISPTPELSPLGNRQMADRETPDPLHPKIPLYQCPGLAESPSQTLFTTIKPVCTYHHLQVCLAKCHRIRQMLHGECEAFFACEPPYGNYRIIECDVIHAAGLFWDASPQAPIQVKLWKKQNPHPHGYQVRSGQVRSGQVRSGQNRSGQNRFSFFEKHHAARHSQRGMQIWQDG